MTGNESKAGLPVGGVRQLGQDGETNHTVGELSGSAQVANKGGQLFKFSKII